MTSKKIKGRRDVLKKSAKLAAIAAFIPVALTWFHLYNPYFYHFKTLKLLMYSLTMLIPVIIEIIIRSSNFFFYPIVYAYHFFVFVIAIYLYHRAKSKKAFFSILSISVLLYVATSLMILW